MEASANSFQYRPEIDGLRAISIIAVILYHTQLKLGEVKLLEGGYIGVDIFFVISGFLITSVIQNEVKLTNSFNLRRFYVKRIRRLLPMLLMTIVLSIPFAYFLMVPSELVEFAKSVIASLAFTANFFFYVTTTEYGAANSLLKPFLHAWSLSIEEQFYLIYPVLFLPALNLYRVINSVLITSLSISFGLCIFLVIKNTSLNFYLPFTRFWEILGGCLAARLHEKMKIFAPAFFHKHLAIIGLVLIAISFILFNKGTLHPSWRTALPVVGSILILSFATQTNMTGKLLSNRILVGIGAISYSLYLIHFPLFAFSRINEGTLSFQTKLYLLVILFFLSQATYRLIERPFRNFLKVNTTQLILYISGTTILITLFVSLAIIRNGFPARLERAWENFMPDSGVLREGFWKEFIENRASLSTPSKEKINVYIFGNSHSGDLISALQMSTENYSRFHFLKVGQYEQLGCFDETDNRFEKQRQALYTSSAYKASEIFVIATRFVNAKCESELAGNPSDRDGLQFLIPRLKRDNKKIVVMGNTAVFEQIRGKWIEEYIYKMALTKELSLDSKANFSELKKLGETLLYKHESKENLITNLRLRDFAAKNGLGYFARRDLFCDDHLQRCQVFTQDGHRIRYDYGHLTRDGKQLYSHLLKANNFNSLLRAQLSKQSVPNIIKEYTPYTGSVVETED